jgi:hypothetical protein
MSATQDTWPAPLREPAYHGVIGKIVQSIAPETEADPAGILVQVLAMLGNVIGRTAHFRVGPEKHHLNLFAALVGDSAKGRKGVSSAMATSLFEQVDEDWVKGCRTSGLSSGEGLIWAIRDPIEKTQPIKEKGRVVDYQTVVEDQGIADKRLFAIEQEMASTLKVMEREGSTLSPAIRQAWDGHTLKVLTKNSPARATDPHISIIAMVTAMELRRYLTATEAGNGFGNRFLWVCVKRARELPDGGKALDLTEHAARLRQVVHHGRHLRELRRSPQAGRL